MTEHGKKSNLRNVTVCHIHTEGLAEYVSPECEGIFHFKVSGMLKIKGLRRILSSQRTEIYRVHI